MASLGGLAGFFFSPDTQRCVGLRGAFRGHPLQALRHCADERSGTHQSIASPDADPRQLAGTRWVFWIASQKTYATFNPDGSVSFSDPSLGTGGVWSLAGTRGVAFHTDAYEFGGTIGRSVPDRFDVAYRSLPSAGGDGAERVTTFTRVAASE